MSDQWLPPDIGGGPGRAEPTHDISSVGARPAPAPPPAAQMYVPGGFHQPGGFRTDQEQQSAGGIVAVWVIAALTIGYMLPWAVAVSRGKRNHGAIALVNLLTGWTLIGWIVALVMACQAHQVVQPAQTVIVAQQFSTPAGWYPAPDGTGQRYWDGQTWTQHWAP